jgi:pimeloyl-ACP methyl ester carboxylesterase
MNRFPKDFNGNLTGFGGDPGMNQAQHRDAIKHTPVILVHGNGANASHPKWGWSSMVEFLKKIGYNDCELWAMDYLGEENDQPDLPIPHTKHINEFRIFVDRVIAYLGVEQVDFIAHSLGCGMVNAYLRGLQSDGTWKDDDHRLEKVCSFVALAGGTYGLGPYSTGEFQTGSAFEVRSHKSNGITDDAPFGSDSQSEQDAPVMDWKKVTSLDNDEVKYAAIIAENDFVDMQNKDTSRREGAHLNRRFNLGYGLAGHEKIIKDQNVFDAFKGYLNRCPPIPPVTIRVDKASGNYGSNLQITISVEPADTAVDYRAERLTKAFEAGYITKHVAETRSGTLADGESITLVPDGAWEVTFSAAGAAPVVCTYGVNVVLPIATIITPNDEPFEGSLTVMASTTKGVLYHSLDAEHWIEGATVPITGTATVFFIAIDADGLASPLVSRPYEYKPAVPQKTATLTEHLIVGRLTVDQYLALGRELGFTAVITLYLIDGKWVYDPHKPERGVAAPTGLLSLALEARGVKPRGEQLVISADKPNGEYAEGFEVRISASDPNGNPVPVYYTKDGSDPANARNPNRHRFVGSQSFTISGSGNHAIFCYARDSSGNERFEPFTWSIQG